MLLILNFSVLFAILFLLLLRHCSFDERKSIFSVSSASAFCYSKRFSKDRCLAIPARYTENNGN